MHEKTASISCQILRYVIKHYGLKQVRIAEKLGVHNSYISKVSKRQRNFTLSHLIKLSEIVGLDLRTLIWVALAPETSGSAKPS